MERQTRDHSLYLYRSHFDRDRLKHKYHTEEEMVIIHQIAKDLLLNVTTGENIHMFQLVTSIKNVIKQVVGEGDENMLPVYMTILYSVYNWITISRDYKPSNIITQLVDFNFMGMFDDEFAETLLSNDLTKDYVVGLDGTQPGGVVVYFRGGKLYRLVPSRSYPTKGAYYLVETLEGKKTVTIFYAMMNVLEMHRSRLEPLSKLGNMYDISKDEDMLNDLIKRHGSYYTSSFNKTYIQQGEESRLTLELVSILKKDMPREDYYPTFTILIEKLKSIFEYQSISHTSRTNYFRMLRDLIQWLQSGHSLPFSLSNVLHILAMSYKHSFYPVTDNTITTLALDKSKEEYVIRLSKSTTGGVVLQFPESLYLLIPHSKSVDSQKILYVQQADDELDEGQGQTLVHLIQGIRNHKDSNEKETQ